MRVRMLGLLAGTVVLSSAAFAAPAAGGGEKVCTAGVGKPYVMPLFINGRNVETDEIGNGRFFARSEVMPSASALTVAASCCAEKPAAVQASAGCGDRSASAAGCGDKAASCCAEKQVKASHCEESLTVKNCEVGNRGFFASLECPTCTGHETGSEAGE